MAERSSGDGSWKPNLFVPGFPKCGTTALCDYLRQNPEVYVMEPKEPQTLAIGIEVPPWAKKHTRIARPYFRYLDADEYRADLEGHRGFRYRAEGSQSYIWPPHFPGRLKRFAPDAKLIFMIREQKERLLSLYSHGFWNHLEPDFRRWVETRFSPRMEPFLFTGMLESYHRLFGDSMRVMDNGALLESPEPVMREVFDFLGVEEARVRPVRSNVGGMRGLNEYQRRRVAPSIRLRRTVTSPARYFFNVMDPGGNMGVRRFARRLSPLKRLAGASPGRKGKDAVTGRSPPEDESAIPGGVASRLDEDYESALRFCRSRGLLLGPG